MVARGAVGLPLPYWRRRWRRIGGGAAVPVRRHRRHRLFQEIGRRIQSHDRGDEQGATRLRRPRRRLRGRPASLYAQPDDGHGAVHRRELQERAGAVPAVRASLCADPGRQRLDRLPHPQAATGRSARAAREAAGDVLPAGREPRNADHGGREPGRRSEILEVPREPRVDHEQRVVHDHAHRRQQQQPWPHAGDGCGDRRAHGREHRLAAQGVRRRQGREQRRPRAGHAGQSGLRDQVDAVADRSLFPAVPRRQSAQEAAAERLRRHPGRGCRRDGELRQADAVHPRRHAHLPRQQAAGGSQERALPR